MKIKFPSLDDKNKLTWKCKLFGCRKHKLHNILCEEGEKHGLNFGKYGTAIKTGRIFSCIGCYWCQNWKKVFEREEYNINNYRVWICDCDQCNMVE